MVVSGRVQGVWFRQSCRQEAERLAIVGWARNRTDGTVEVEAEGSAEAVSELTRWTEHGPPQAEVAGVDVMDVPVEGGSTFEVR